MTGATKPADRRLLALAQRRASSTTSSSPAVKPVVIKEFPNGDKYEGGWEHGLPEGEGVYAWVDGSSYNGVWKAGSKQGVGTYTWANGATYSGEWQVGYSGTLLSRLKHKNYGLSIL